MVFGVRGSRQGGLNGWEIVVGSDQTKEISVCRLLFHHHYEITDTRTQGTNRMCLAWSGPLFRHRWRPDIRPLHVNLDNE